MRRENTEIKQLPEKVANQVLTRGFSYLVCDANTRVNDVMKFKIGNLQIIGRFIKGNSNADGQNSFIRKKVVLLTRKKALLYYAHPMIFYSSRRERRAISLIDRFFRNVQIINPKNYKLAAMNEYTDLVKSCDIVVFECMNNMITVGFITSQ